MSWLIDRVLRVAISAAVGLFAAACYVDSSYDPYNPYGYQPSYSVGVVTHAPEAPYFTEAVWYYGVHPHPDGHHLGRFCNIQGAHSHGYDPFHRHRYEFHDGYYFWLGDPMLFGITTGLYSYFGHHPLSHYFGGYCYITGRHHHNYSPLRNHAYDHHGGAFHFRGNFGSDYYDHRQHYDSHGWRHDRSHHAYDDHHQWKHYRESTHHQKHDDHHPHDQTVRVH